jgi:hypothetical protein
MPITLLPPLTRGGPFHGGVRSEALTEGPAFARSRGGSRWHRVRSAIRHFIDTEPSHTSYLAVCGTCEGRALGFDPKRPGLLFTPATLAPPRFCPNRTLFEDAGSNVGRCLACQQFAPVKVHGWNGYPKLQLHVALELVAGCPFHAWRYLVEADGSVVCRCSIESTRGAEARDA